MNGREKNGGHGGKAKTFLNQSELECHPILTHVFNERNPTGSPGKEAPNAQEGEKEKKVRTSDLKKARVFDGSGTNSLSGKR